jgi:hypothetical protein
MMTKMNVVMVVFIPAMTRRLFVSTIEVVDEKKAPSEEN